MESSTTTVENSSASSSRPKGGSLPGATHAVVLLTLMNLLNFIDRYVPSAVKDAFKADLHLETDLETSLPFTAFIWVYMIAAPIFGTLAEKYSRKKLITFGVILWSIATASAALATDFWTFMFARALVGVGEAAYATIAPSLIADFYVPEKRNRVLTFFYVAIPVGAALGFVLGGFFGDYFGEMLGPHYGWRVAFLICGLPGILVALFALRIKDVKRGGLDDVDESDTAPPPPWRETLPMLLGNRRYLTVVAGYTAVTFAVGGLSDWLPTFLQRVHGMSQAGAGSGMGIGTVVGGLFGTIVGGLLADKLKGRTKNPYLALSGLSMLPATLFGVLALVAKDGATAIILIGVAQFFLWFYNGPINALLVNSVDFRIRARAFSLSILSIHLLGDAISPPLIGALADVKAIGLQNAIAIVPIGFFVGALIWLIGWRSLTPVEIDSTSTPRQKPTEERESPTQEA
ncbi:MAG: MFS transporter [Deltaproteobacteria bacterium]|nr:MFS transporter [Deltaproteobacteria bacterium]